MISVEVMQLLGARITFAAGVIVFLLIGCLSFLATQERQHFWEPLARNKWIGLFAGWIALALCVPHAVVVVPEFLLPWLWPVAVIIPVLGFFAVDYPAARALGGGLILLGYYLVHFSFEFRTPGFPVIAVAGWLSGIAGIWISGKPCAMRDYFRMLALRKGMRRAACAFWGAEALLALWALVMTKGGAQ